MEIAEIKTSRIIQKDLIQNNKEEIISEIVLGLTSEPKYISSKLFYDSVGSHLFEKITQLPEYYLTRTEISILKAIAPEITRNLSNTDLVELGSGDCTKISIILDAIPSNILPSIRYIPVDISESAIIQSGQILSQKYPGLLIQGLRANFVKHLHLLNTQNKRYIFFLGGTLGNLSREESLVFLIQLRKLMNKGDRLMLGLDSIKELSVMHQAYNDKQGITASFNKNILKVVNKYAQTNFNSDDFEHLAFYNSDHHRIEMHLKAKHTLQVSSPFLPYEISFKRGETVHTENSHKFAQYDVLELASLSGFRIYSLYTDYKQWFYLVVLTI